MCHHVDLLDEHFNIKNNISMIQQSFKKTQLANQIIMN